MIDHVPIDFAKIKRLRERLKLTQEEAAELAGFGKHKQAWSRMEQGKMPNMGILTLEKVASTLGVKAKDLLK